jgi:hypothetical protein
VPCVALELAHLERALDANAAWVARLRIDLGHSQA